jgi:hypothetical protein
LEFSHERLWSRPPYRPKEFPLNKDAAEIAKRLYPRRLPLGVNVVATRTALAALADQTYV